MATRKTKKSTKRKIFDAEETYFITAAQSVQTAQHADQFGPDSSKGAPNKDFVRNLDALAERSGASTMIIQEQGMNILEQHLHPWFDGRDDLVIPSENLSRLERQIIRERRKEAALDARAEKKDMTLAEFIAKNGSVLDPNYLERNADYFREAMGDGIDLNSKISVANVNSQPQNKNPARTGMEAIHQVSETSIIHAHPRQTWTPVAKNMSGKLPRLNITTGACTHPNFGSNDLGKKAKWNHQYGFARVDIIDNNLYLARLVPVQKNGTFIDLGQIYRPGKRGKRANVAALVLGDLHGRQIDPMAWDASLEMITEMRPERVIIHDDIDGQTFNPHEQEDPFYMARLAEIGKSKVYDELRESSNRAKDLSKKFPKTQFFYVPDNHGDFIYRWAMQNSNKITPENFKFYLEFGAELIKRADEREVAFETAMRMMGPYNSNIHFLKNGEDLKIGGYQLGAHGHKGKNGGKGTARSMKDAYAKVISGHGHAITQNGNALTSGTLAKMPMPYQVGNPSTTSQGNVALYRNGGKHLAQGIPIVYGKWRID
jgi:hypothetical protein